MPLRVLIVEDNPSERKGLRAFVERCPALTIYDVEIFEAADGEEGLQSFRDHDPDLALVDLLLPKIDGMSLIRELRQAHRGDLLGIVANSGIYRDSGVSRELAGMRVELLIKPLDHRLLTRKILALLEERKTLDAERARGWLRARPRPTRRSGRIPQIGGAIAEQPATPAASAGATAPATAAPAIGAPVGGGLAGGGLRRVDTSVDAADIDFSGPARGHLEKVPLAALLVRAAAQKATGTLRLTRGKVRKVIFTLEGTPIFVDSNLRNETLGAYLVAQGQLDETQLARAMREARAHKKKLGEALVSLRLADAQTVEAGLRAQTGIKIISALRWGDGSFHYTPGHDFKGKVPNCPVDVVPMVLSALARFFDGEELRARVAALLDHGVRLTALGRSNIESIMRVFGADLLADDTDRLPLRQLMDRSSDGAALLVQVEVLRRAGLAELALVAAAAMPRPAMPRPAIPQPALPQPAMPQAAMPQPAPRSHGAPGAMPRLAGSGVGPLPGPGAAAPGSGAMPQVAGGLPPMPAPAPRPPAASGSQGRRSADVPPGQARARAGRASAGLPRFSLGPTRAAAGADGSHTIELELEAPSPPAALELRDLAPTSKESATPLIELELEQPAPMPPSWADQDSGVLEIPSTEGLELEEPHTSSPLLSSTALPPPGVVEAPAVEQLALEEPVVSVESASPVELASASPVEPASSNAPPVETALAEAFNQVEAGIDPAHPSLPPPPMEEQGLGADAKHAAAVEGALDQAPLALAEPPASAPDTFGAELYFQEGEGLLRAGELPGAVRALEQAVEANPEQPDYHGLLGWAFFLHRGRGVAGAMAARPHFERAFQIAKDSVRVHELAGRVEQDAHDYMAAAHHFGRALRYGPPRMDLFSSVKDLLTRAGDFTRLEQHYRDMILRLRDHPQRTLVLWVDLAHIYHEKLDQQQNAQLALEVAAKIAPGDPRVQAAQSAIAAAAGGPWEPIAEGHRQRLAASPLDPGPLHQLFGLHKGGGRPDLLLTVAAILEARGAATDEEKSQLEALRPATLRRATRPFDEACTTLCRHPSDEAATQEVVAELAEPLAELFNVDERLGIAAEPIALAELPEPLRDSLIYASEQLGVPMPPIHRALQLSRLAPRPGPAAALLVGAEVLADGDQRRLAFGAARVFSCLAPGRREVFVRRATDLKVAFLGALTACRPGTKVPDADGQIARFRDLLLAHESRVSRLQVLLERLFGAGGKFNLSEWMRGVQRTSARVGVLVGGDLSAALALLAADAGTRDDLIDFALGADYANARRERGIALA